MSSGERYQIALIAGGILSTILFGAFLWREIYPEYKIYQNVYQELEEFRSTYTGEAPPPFKDGVKQIVLLKEDKGPPTIDRCTSCHVALNLSHFSPTKIARDLNGNIIRNKEGQPDLVPNNNSVWYRLDQKIAELRLPGSSEADRREADRLESLKTAKVGEHEWDMTKVLAMHPLMGREMRPFEYHPVEEYGCTVCHGGNGRGLVTDRAHGPVLDGTYEEAQEGPTPKFLEKDPDNDPLISRAYNHKPGHRLLFQTTPILVGDLIQAKCVQCHNPTGIELQSVLGDVDLVSKRKSKQKEAILGGFIDDWKAMEALVELRKEVMQVGVEKTAANLEARQKNYTYSSQAREQFTRQEEFLKSRSSEQDLLEQIEADLIRLTGSVEEAEKLVANSSWEKFLETPVFEMGSMSIKADEIRKQKEVLDYLRDRKAPLEGASREELVLAEIQTDVDSLTQAYQRGRELFVAQACYACHRIAGFARGGIGPELTQTGMGYPWFIKESIVWPQADLKTSTMPNMKLDHEEINDLMTFLLAQRTDGQVISSTKERILKKAWEEGNKEIFEKPIPPSEIRDVRNSMIIFATEGCASCHRLRGFESNVGFAIEKQDSSFDALQNEKSWFQNLIPEEVLGSRLVEMVDQYQEEIDQRIVDGVREGGLLEEIEEKYPELTESFYSNFKFAMRAKNTAYQNDPEKLKAWDGTVRRILMMYIQEYGLGRLIGPRPNWSGVYRSDQWLMEHFWNPSSHAARSIMPVLPFDNTKFLALTHMLNVLGEKNRDYLRQIWTQRGFNPEGAFQTLCSQCHGTFLQGNGPVAEWIYPIPKNLRNPLFLRNLTKENALHSILHGVKGGPMPPWGEIADDKQYAERIPVLSESEAEKLVDWLFANLPGERVIESEEDVLKWQYTPEDVQEELEKAGDKLKATGEAALSAPNWILSLPNCTNLYASVEDVPSSDEPPSNAIFDVVPNPLGSPEPYLYYIKKKYYTPQNIKAGEDFFLTHCAVCHGNDADGSGERSGSMSEAKPRMLINLDWLETRDDLRLLRSIKFGVLGTSMTPWGDLTTSLQRLQLVMYIRSVSNLQIEKKAFFDLLYQSFETSIWAIQQAREENFKKLRDAEKSLSEIQLKRYLGERRNSASKDELAALYTEELELKQETENYRTKDEDFLKLIDLVKQQGKLYESLGISFFNLYGDSKLFQKYLEVVELNRGQFSFSNGEITYARDGSVDEKTEEIIASLNQTIEKLDHEKEKLFGQIASHERSEKLDYLENRLKANHELKIDFISTLAELKRLKKTLEETGT